MVELTELEKEYLYYIKCYINEHGYPPSVREIAKNMYVSTTTAHRHLTKLVDKDYLRFSPKISRSYHLKGSA